MDPDEAAYYEPSNLDVHCLQSQLFSFWRPPVLLIQTASDK